MSDTPPPRVHTSSGELEGAIADGVRRFLGIPYAAPPVGEHRFAEPVPVQPWQGVRLATAFGPTPPQRLFSGLLGDVLADDRIDGDDVLTLNVWAPADASDAPLPVMLWFHGGSLELGSSAQGLYDGTPFARDGVIYVSANYRLGSEGFSVLDGAPRNLGLTDAVVALEWVHREIAAFGGDPDRITVFGESAGGMIVAGLLSRVDALPHIAGAIIQSGPLAAQPVSRAGRVTRALAKRLRVRATRDGFAAVRAGALVTERARQAASASLTRPAPQFTLAIDPDTLPASPTVAIADVDIPIMLGTNTDEYRLWLHGDALDKVSALQLSLVIAVQGMRRRVLRAYRRAFASASPGELLGQILTDTLLRAPAVRLAEARNAPTWIYEFAWPSPVRDIRAAHALEIGFVFDALAHPSSVGMTGPDAPQALATRMHDDWVRFARTGDPGWDEFALERTVQVYDAESRVEPLPRAEALASLRVPRRSGR